MDVPWGHIVVETLNGQRRPGPEDVIVCWGAKANAPLQAPPRELVQPQDYFKALFLRSEDLDAARSVAEQYPDHLVYLFFIPGYGEPKDRFAQRLSISGLENLRLVCPQHLLLDGVV